MQLPRVIIAAVFFVIGALIAIPALTRGTTTPSNASHETPTSSSPTAGPPTHRTTPKTTHKATTPVHTPSVRPSAHTSKPVTHKPSLPAAPPIVPLTSTVSSVRCPSRSILVTTHNAGTTTQDYKIDQPGSSTLYDRIDPGGTRVNKLTLTEDKATRITVSWSGHTVRTTSRTANCTHKAAPTHKPTALPHTGIDQAALYARIATGVGAMLTGVIIFWYGGIWPRRRDPMFGLGRRGTPQDTPDDAADPVDANR